MLGLLQQKLAAVKGCYSMDFLEGWLLYMQDRGQAWVVGGALRDHLLGLPTSELDLVITIAPAALPTALWQQTAHSFWLDETRQILRAIEPNGQSFDIAPLQGEDIHADLSCRDFTVNAMAMTLSEWIGNREALIDPRSGKQDLAARRLRLVSPNALLDDPVRVLRGVRLAVEKQLILEPPIVKQMREVSSQLPAQAAERLTVELSRILMHPLAAAGADLLAQVGATESLFPEGWAMQKVTQNKYHQFTVSEHSRRAFAAFVSIIHTGHYLTAKAQAWFADYWHELSPSLQAATMFAAWLHDIGKPPARVIRKGRVTFYDHEQVGAEMAVAIAKRLRLSNAQQELIKCFVRLHMYPMQLWRTEKFGPQLIHRFYQRAGQYGPLIVVFTLADYLAKGDNLAGTQEFAAHKQVVEDFLKAYFCQQAELVNPEPLLNHNEMMEVANQAPGAWLRQARRELLEAQAAGQVQSREQAVRWLQDWWQQQATRHKGRPY